VTTEQLPIAPRPPRSAPRLQAWIVLRGLAASLIVLSWAGMLATAGQPASLERLVSDLQHGRTHHVFIVGHRAVWRDGAVRARELDLSLPDTLDRRGRLDDLAGLPAALMRYQVPAAAVIHVPTVLDPRLPLTLGGLLAFLVLIGGPDPWRFNRWGWFWIFGVGEGIALGAMGFLLLSTASAWRRSDPHKRRGTGGEGLLWAFLLGLLVTIAGAVLQHVWLFPELVDHGVDVSYVTPPA
jgi:hypothetical protein